ncbi:MULTISPECIES: DUF1453 domain-containing protein [unclassified Streptomyces]|uniref:DUF1453 domain-containing protein n=1 Tax=unclassified Streptomyces TaxID=2593676 RepID=UPI002E15379B|nr:MULTISPECIES: DUF1453 domain-containing protein [unclassified Streptomyces]WSQ84440.1 DUF1453 domain-containing protein [Streptomyces sp. NBC_01212]WSR09506.1 DUF1453 domain-containing protein [Streptomyces sp. NBC_01208]
MPELFNVLVIVAVVALVIVRQFSAQRVGDGRRWWVLPVVLLVVALRTDGALDPRHETLSATMLGAGLVVGLVTGAGWGWTARLWQGPDASFWSRGTTATVFVWVGGTALRGSLAVAAVLLGVHQGTAALLVSLAAMLFARSGVLALRTRSMREQYGVPAVSQAGDASAAAARVMSKGGA